jgi:RNA polymerase sigma-70 factor (ECF subfamily)
MKTKTLLTTLVIGAICQFAPQLCRAQDIDSMAPVVVKTVPEAGTKDVAPGIVEIKITFSKEMMDGSWSWSSAWKDSSPEGVGKPHYEADHKTCVLKVKLEPNQTYGYWINSQNFHNFKDAQGHPAVPYMLVFQTKGN